MGRLRRSIRSLITYGGQKWPDIVGALHVKQGWGEAQVSGVIHNVNVTANGYDNSVVGSTPAALTRSRLSATGGSTTRSAGRSTRA